MQIGIAGSGLLGRLCACWLIAHNHQVTLFDQDKSSGEKSCGFIAAGMLALFTERDSLSPQFQVWAKRSLQLWPEILKLFSQTVSFQQQGSLLVSHTADQSELKRYANTLKNQNDFAKIDQEAIKQLEPALSFNQGLFFPEDGCINTAEFYQASTFFLKAHGCEWYENTCVTLSPHVISNKNNQWNFDEVIDCRGLGAKNDWPQLRGVRGEIVLVENKEFNLQRPVRVLHPRYNIYVVPRHHHQFIVGATEIESEDESPMSVQSALELLSALYALHPSFAEARIIAMHAAARPALPDHLPAYQSTAGLLRLNGLYRHGYLLGPALVEEAMVKTIC